MASGSSYLISNTSTHTLWTESEKESLKKVQEVGVEILYPEKEPFAEKVMVLYEEYRSDPVIWDLIQRIIEEE